MVQLGGTRREGGTEKTQMEEISSSKTTKVVALRWLKRGELLIHNDDARTMYEDKLKRGRFGPCCIVNLTTSNSMIKEVDG